jgi:hypothetical protein
MEQDYQHRREQAVNEAVEMKKAGGPIRWKLFEKKYNVKRSSIRHYVESEKQPRTRSEACKVRAKTSAGEDGVLEEYILRKNYGGNFPSMNAFLETANDLVRDRQTREKRPIKELTRRWARNWLKKHGTISTRKIRTIQKSLLDGYTKEICEHYFKSLEETVKEVDEDLIYIFDETGFSMGDISKLRGKRIYYSHSSRDRRYVGHTGGQEWLTNNRMHLL